jgi:hypothetical protein
VLLKDIYRRYRDFGLEPNEVVRRLTALAYRWLAMPVMKWYVKSKRGEILSVEDWQNEVVSLAVGIDAATGDYLVIHDKRYFHPALDEPVEFYVRSGDTEDIPREKLLESGNNVTSDYSPVEKFEQEEGLRPRTPTRLTPTAPLGPPSKEPAPTSAPKKKRRKAKQRSRAGRPPPAPPASQTAPDQQPASVQQPENKAGPVLPTRLRTSDQPKRVSTQEWVTAEAVRLKKDNKIPKDITRPTDFAKLLAEAEANDSTRPIGWRHIKNMLPAWGLWPIESIPSKYPDAFRDA